jgi:methanogenic corrinoid protein MtbC1
MEELQGLMGLTPFNKSKQDAKNLENTQIASNELLIESWIQYLHVCDDDALLNEFHEQWVRHGSLNFILNFAVPLLKRVGRGWEREELTISHEHFVSECMVSFLTEKWRQMNLRKKGPLVLITTLPGESYNLGILMCAVVTSATNSKVIYLGIDNPLEEIIDGTEKYKPEVIALSISHKFDYVSAEILIKKLRKEINSNTYMVTGGKGSPWKIPGISYIPDFSNYYDFLVNYVQPKIYQVKGKVNV